MQSSRQRRVGLLLDRLETRGDRAFGLFMDGLRENYRQVANVIDETLRHNDNQDETGHRERTTLAGETVRKLIRGARRRTEPNQDDSGDELDVAIQDERDEDGYIDCYAIPMRGKQARESWIKHINEPRVEVDRDRDDSEPSYMANLVRETIFRRIELASVPDGIRVPPTLCPLYVVDPDQTYASHADCSCPVIDDDSSTDNRDLSSEKHPLQTKTLPVPPTNSNEEVMEDAPVRGGQEKPDDHNDSMENAEQLSPAGSEPPPVPPKPGNLPPLSPGPPTLRLRLGVGKDKQLPDPKDTEKLMVLRHKSRDRSPLPVPGDDPESYVGGMSGDATPEASSTPIPNGVCEEAEYQDDPTISLTDARPLSMIEESQSLESVTLNKLKESVQSDGDIASGVKDSQSIVTPATKTDGTSKSKLSLIYCDSNGNVMERKRIAETEAKLQNGDTQCSTDANINEPQNEKAEPETKEPFDDSERLDKSTEIKAVIVNGDEESDYTQPPDEYDESYETITPREERSNDNINREYKKLERVGADGESSSTERPDSGVTDQGSEPSITSDVDGQSVGSALSKEATPPPRKGDDKEASQESLADSESLVSSARSTLTDSGIDAPNTVAMAPVPPVRSTSTLASQKSSPTTPGGSRRHGKLPKPPQLFPRITAGSSDINIPAAQKDDGSSEEDSYYEDIEMVDTSSPSGRSNMSYVDPKSYAHALENSLVNDTRKSMERLVHSRPVAKVSDEDEQRVALGRGELLIADTDEICTTETDGGTDLAYFKGAHIAYDKLGRAFYIPRLLLKKHGDPEGEPWFYPIEMTSRHATLFLGLEKQEGCFLVYRPAYKSSNAVYNLSVCRANGDVVHYHIVENAHGDVMVEHHDRSFMNVRDLVTYFQQNKSGLATRLRRPLREAKLPVTPGYHYELKWEIHRSSLSLTGQIIGKGNFGVVCAGVYNKIPVAVKVLQKPEASIVEEDDFIEEALRLMGLKHEHVLRLVGVSCVARPFFLVTEYVSRGNLRDCLRDGTLPSDNLDTLFDICIQITSALYYLESRQYLIHRDLAARNFLVASDLCVKLADFGRAKFVTDDSFQASRTEKISVKWAAPEVLAESMYCTKSDVWSLGVVFWEVLSGGDRPYASLSAEQVAVYVTEGGRLDKPPGCSPDLFSIIKNCWRHLPDERPSAASLYDTLKSKSSLYYGPVGLRPRIITSSESSGTLKPPRAPETPLRQTCVNATSSPAPSNRSIRPTTPTPKSRKTVSLDSRTEEYARDMLEHIAATGGHHHHHGHLTPTVPDPGRLPPSSSEASLISAVGSQGQGKDDLTRGDKIRKSLKKIMTVKRGRKSHKGDGIPAERHGSLGSGNPATPQVYV